MPWSIRFFVKAPLFFHFRPAHKQIREYAAYCKAQKGTAHKKSGTMGDIIDYLIHKRQIFSMKKEDVAEG